MPHLPTAPACTGCGQHLDGATCPDDPAAQPSDGDTSICALCGAFNIFQGQGTALTFREPTTAESVHIMGQLMRLMNQRGI